MLNKKNCMFSTIIKKTWLCGASSYHRLLDFRLGLISSGHVRSGYAMVGYASISPFSLDNCSFLIFFTGLTVLYHSVPILRDRQRKAL